MVAVTLPSVRLESKSLDLSTTEIRTIAGREEISRLFRFEIDFVAPANAPLVIGDLIGQDASLIVDAHPARTIHGMISEATDLLTSIDNWRFYRLTLVPRMHRLTLIDTQEVLLNVSIHDVIKRKLGLVGLEGESVKWLPAEPPLRDIVVEYKETDLAFVSRLAEHAGVSFYFAHDHGEDRIVFADVMESFAIFDQPPAGVPFTQNEAEWGVRVLSRSARAMPETFIVSDYNYRNPLVDISGSHKSDSGLAGGVLAFGENTRSADESSALARIRAEESAANHDFYRGESNVAGFGAGMRFKVHGHPCLDGDPELLLVEVIHTFSRPSGQAEMSYKNEFRAVPTDRTYRPPRRTPKPRISGVVSALVEPSATDVVADFPTIDPEGRYTVRFAFDPMPINRRSPSSLPMRMVQLHAGTGYGVHFPLHPGVEVIVAFEDGDPDRPIILGAVPNQVTASPVQEAHQNESRIQTASGIRVTIRDY